MSQVKQPVVIKTSSPVAVDAEWDGILDLVLSCQFASAKGDRAIYLNKGIAAFVSAVEFQALVERTVKWSKSRKVAVIWVEFTDSLNLLKLFLDTFDLSHLVDLRLFYSLKDLTIALGKNAAVPLYAPLDAKEKAQGTYLKRLEQRRNITAFELPIDGLTVSIHDLKGWQPVGGLDALASSTGVNMGNKKAMDKYKSHMLDGLLEDTDTFLDYSIDDAVKLNEIADGFYKFVNGYVIEGILNLEPFEKLPHTTGSLVAKTFERWLESLFEDKTAFKLACRKVGKLNVKSTSVYAKRHNDLFDRIKFASDVNPTDPEVTKVLACKEYINTGISAGAVQVLGLATESTLALNAIVQGGRCNNERPEEYSIGHGLDIDLSSAYGSALVEFKYPIGLPSQYGFTGTERGITLKDFFKLFPLFDPATGKGELLPGLWQVMVNGKLTFQQDLLFSKKVEISEINKACRDKQDKTTDIKTTEDRDSDLSHIPGIFMLTRKELQNAILTADIWKALVATATEKELKELYNLEVRSACFYKASDRVKVADWTNTVLASDGSFRTSKTGAGGIVDDRTTAWCEVPIGEFMGELLAERKRVKSESNNAVKGSLEQIQAKAKDTSLKLFINTLYGVFCSIYFPVGNAVVANNITARARLGTWMMNKALWTRQSITDGGIYSPSEVPLLLPGKKPGLHILSDWKRWKDSKNGTNRKTTALGNIDWITTIENRVPLVKRGEQGYLDIDAIALDHVNNFWSNYNLQLPFAIEHKRENSFLSAAYLSKSHYGLLVWEKVNGCWTQEIKYKIRGAKEYANADEYQKTLRLSPMYQLLTNIICGSDEFPLELTYDHFYLLKLTKYREIQGCNGYLNQKHLLPGDEVIEDRTFHLNNLYTSVDTVDEYLKRYKRTTAKTVKGTRINLELFEHARDAGISKVVSNAIADRLRTDYKASLPDGTISRQP